MQLFDLSGKRALVTGGGTGIGQALALALAEAGAGVAICGRRRERLEQATEAARAQGVTIQAISADVTREDDVQRLRQEAGEIDILVNNAGGARQGPWLEVTLEAWRDVTALNLDAAFRLSQVFARGMISRGWGRIINVASVYASVVGDPARYPGRGVDNASYVAAKHALLGITKHLAAQMGRTGVTVNAISPGMIAVEKHAAMLTAEVTAALSAGAPVGRLGTPEDLKTAVVFLAAPGSGFVTGHNLVVDGGWTLW